MHRTTAATVLAAAILSSACRTDPLSTAPASPPDANGLLKAEWADSVECSHRTPSLPSPDRFVAGIDNPYLHFAVGRTFRYQGESDEGTEEIVVEVTNQTRTILGVQTTVVRDRVYVEGALVEDTLDWFAQDDEGNVWYFGEDSKQIENGVVVGTEGSWEAGVNGAEPGIIMLAHPRVGIGYAQENAENVAEDRARIVSRSASVEVAFGEFERCLEIMEWTPLEPGAREYKYYAKDVGLVLESQRRHGRGDRVELIVVEN